MLCHFGGKNCHFHHWTWRNFPSLWPLWWYVFRRKKHDSVSFLGLLFAMLDCNRGSIWMFPKMVVHPNHPILIGFSLINHPFWSTPSFGNTYIVSQHDSYIRSHKNLSPWTKMMRFFRSMTLGFPLPPKAVQRQGEVRGRTKAIGGGESVRRCWYGREGFPPRVGFPHNKNHTK